MSYNINELPRYINTAGKITVLTALLGVVVFAVVFLLNIGVKEINHAVAQSSGLATTTVTVLNTPPQWTVDAEEVTESSTSSPTNSGSVVSWHATATDSNSEDYYLLICSGTSTPTEPTANAGSAPTCANGQTQWAVSAVASSGAAAVAATTTLDRNIAPGPGAFGEQNPWFAWVCDSVALNPRCNSIYKQGSGNTASPFAVNSRPLFTGISNNGPVLPGGDVVFTSVSEDDDVLPDDRIRLWVCATQSFNSTSTIGCNGATLASTTAYALANATSTYSLNPVIPDGAYQAYSYIVDFHDHAAIGIYQGTSSPFTVLNATPTVAAGQIVLNDGNPLTLTQNFGQTTGFTIQYVVQDSNSCSANEVVDYRVSVYRSGVGQSGCSATSSLDYDANDCYTTGVATTTWNLACTASSTSCTYDGVSDFDDEEIWDCTFPLWFIADPTDGVGASTSPYFAEDWRVSVAAVDDNNATSTFVENTTAPDVNDLNGFLYFSLDTLAIPYGSLEPGQFTSNLTASTTIRSEGNIGIDEKLSGTPMCDVNVFNSATTCPTSATSTIADKYQAFGTSSIGYVTATTSGQVLSSTTPYRLDINVLKPTTTATTSKAVTYWGIQVPSSIQLAGDYEGENTFYGVASHGTQWY